jgi:hypothetical protein
VLVAIGIVLGVVYVWWRANDRSVDGYFEVADSFIDSSGAVVASVSFIRVEQYDSLKMLRVGEQQTRTSIENQYVNNQKERDFLFHFYVAGDTAALTEAIVDELAYTHPDIEDPKNKLVMAPGGWVVRAKFAARAIQPKEVIAKRSAFYMPKGGVRARDLR